MEEARRGMKHVRIKTTPMIARDLQPGDLFSISGPYYWTDETMTYRGIGEMVYIRTNRSADIADDADIPVFKIEIELIDSTKE